MSNYTWREKKTPYSTHEAFDPTNKPPHLEAQFLQKDKAHQPAEDMASPMDKAPILQAEI